MFISKTVDPIHQLNRSMHVRPPFTSVFTLRTADAYTPAKCMFIFETSPDGYFGKTYGLLAVAICTFKAPFLL